MTAARTDKQRDRAITELQVHLIATQTVLRALIAHLLVDDPDEASGAIDELMRRLITVARADSVVRSQAAAKANPGTAHGSGQAQAAVDIERIALSIVADLRPDVVGRG
ncbi:hypothetical protein ACO2RV_16995 [Ancylobacter sp. VNQ12]|uniref:hypothetical protein n=1 Tax=Ancylobacter sp. VNQ12 TaxID=3400920 RepID=UPI003C04BB05